MTRASGTEVKVISVQPLPVVFVRLPDWTLLVCYISKGLHAIHIFWPQTCTLTFFSLRLSPKNFPAERMMEARRGLQSPRAQVREWGGSSLLPLPNICLCHSAPPTLLQTSPICDPIDCSHSERRVWVCAGFFFFNLAWMMVPSHPAAHILLRPLLLPRLASFLTSGHNTRPQLCCRDINISARLLSFFRWRRRWQHNKVHESTANN